MSIRTEGFDADADLDIPQLANEKITMNSLCPSEDHIAGGLLDPIAVDALSVIGKVFEEHT